MAKSADRILAELEERLKKQYSLAFKELDLQVKRYFDGWDEVVTDEDTGKQKTIHHKGLYERYKEQEALFDAGEWKDALGNVVTDKREFYKWMYNQERRGKLWIEKRDNMALRLTKTNEIASAYINNELPKVYAYGSNNVASIVQKAAAKEGVVGIRFDLVDEHVLKVMSMQQNKYTLFKYTKISRDKDLEWNKEKLQNALLRGYMNGESIGKIATRFQEAVGGVENMNRSSALRNARTAITAAQNAGKMDRYKDLAEQGAVVTKVWVDVHDSMPPERVEHWEASGQEVPFDEPFIVGGEELMYPGDPNGSGWNIYNCRCHMGMGKVRFTSMLDPDVKATAKFKVTW